MSDQLNQAEQTTRFYNFFGVGLQHRGDQGISDCPFCGSSKFFVRLWDKQTESGLKQAKMFVCKSCSETGNVYTFLNKVMEFSSPVPKPSMDSLCANRGIPKDILEKYEPAFWDIGDDIFFPVRNAENRIINLLKLDQDSYRLMGCPDLGSQLYGLNNFSKDTKRNLWIVEGQWDYMIWKHVLSTTKNEDDVIAVPGVSTFRDEWLGLVAGRKLIILFDNDHVRHAYRCGDCKKITHKLESSKEHQSVANGDIDSAQCKKCDKPAFPNGNTIQPAKDGIDRLLKMFSRMTKKPESVSVLSWPNVYPDGYDIRDLFVKGFK